ncbi:methyltransferase cognate corrinoid proteins [Acetitomaculum ruminis DSM 5522]|uniref:Methyltransferase cognate corrinoid proteins n=1 Tax=Acetitomaculum ruminis DSM 5522 TaxID=1120918 RepID=A0A1I1A5R6_9FIRM|nr:corrinoid protein [Acetitomaculum ruminis]SFB31918.1 methyltransferase cognate corrinoid proteins [Acetitomaculum ruminis DSM 5522]
MSKTKEELLEELSDAVVDMDEELAASTAKEYIDEGYDAYDGISEGLVDGMNKAGELFEEEEYFIPELLLCSDAMNSGIEVLSPHIERSRSKDEKIVVIGVVQGDTHDIGKNLVALMLEVAGYKIVDLGKDVPPQAFVDKAKELNADIIALSTLMTTTMPRMKEVIDILKKENIRENFKVIVGGGPISQKFADEIGADGYSVNATASVRLAQRIVS